jgi:hypothetical protein
MDDDAPATSGEVRFSHNGFTTSTVFHWPISSASYSQPSVELILRQRDDGQWFLGISEDWDNAFDD